MPNSDKNISLKYDFSNGGLIVINTNGFGQGRDFVNYEIVSKKNFSGNFVIKNDTEFGLKINQNEQEDLIISNAEIINAGHVKTYKIMNDLKTFFTEKLTVLFDSKAHSDLASLAKRYILNKFMDTVDYKISYKEDCVYVWLALNLFQGNRKRTKYQSRNEYKLMDAEFCSNRTLIKFDGAKEIPVEKHLVTSKYNISLNYNPVNNWTDKMGAVGTINFEGLPIIQINASYDGLIGSITFYQPNGNGLEIHFNTTDGLIGSIAFYHPNGKDENGLEIHFNTNHYNNWNKKMLIELGFTTWFFGRIKLSLEHLNQNGETNTAFKVIEKNTETFIFEASLTERVITNHAATYLCFKPSSIYSCSIGRILEHEFCHLGCWAV